MNRDESQELREKRAKVAGSIAELTRRRDGTYRANSDAAALDRAGVVNRGPQELASLRDDATAADTELRDAHLELRRLDSEAAAVRGRGLGGIMGRVLRRG